MPMHHADIPERVFSHQFGRQSKGEMQLPLAGENYRNSKLSMRNLLVVLQYTVTHVRGVLMNILELPGQQRTGKEKKLGIITIDARKEENCTCGSAWLVLFLNARINLGSKMTPSSGVFLVKVLIKNKRLKRS